MVYEIIPIYLGNLSFLMYPKQPRCCFIAYMGFGEPSRRFFSKDGAAAKTWAAWHLQARRWPEAWPSLSNERPSVGAGTELVEKKGHKWLFRVYTLVLQIPCEKVFRYPKPTPKLLAEGIGA